MATHKTRTEKLSGHKQVLVFLEGLDHPFSKEIQEVRKIILDADQNLTEQIKWNAPSFCHNREDRITFNLHAKDHFKLIFHCGAKPKDTKTNRQLFNDETGLIKLDYR